MKEKAQDIAYLLNKATHLMRRELGNRLQDFDLTVPQWAVLWDLYMQESVPENERQNTAAQVAERLLSDRPTISGIIDRLSKKGYLRTGPNPIDRRSVLLFLTEEAKRLLPELERRSAETVRSALRGIESGDIERLAGSLAKLVNNMESN
jgi:MarR family transcriptional regulator, lower aerobic nicotinate degradation pathway regulator